MKNFWKQLPKPFSVLAPMEDVTDIVFRQVIEEIASPDVFFTEFVNCEGLMSEGRNAIIHRLDKSNNKQHPIVAQIWGINPSNYKEVAKMIREMGFDGIDINMGCPQKKIIKAGACASLINNPNLAKEIIQATKEGAKDIPVSVKTRIGFNKIKTEEWISFLLEQDIAALTVHLRTAKEMSKVDAHWDEMNKVVALRNKIAPETIIIGNGDVKDFQDIVSKNKQYGMEGGMIGRGIFTNSQAFSKEDVTIELTEKQRVDLCKKHITLFANQWGNTKKYDLLKKYYKIYIQGFDGAKDLRINLMNTKTYEEALNTLFRYYK